MLKTQTIEGLLALRLDAMAQALAEQDGSAAYQGLSFDERLAGPSGIARLADLASSGRFFLKRALTSAFILGKSSRFVS